LPRSRRRRGEGCKGSLVASKGKKEKEEEARSNLAARFRNLHGGR